MQDGEYRVNGTGRYDRPTPVRPEPCLARLADRYVRRRHDDAETLEQAIRSSDHGTVQTLGHCMRGSGAGWGFDGISEIGGRLEEGAEQQDAAACMEALADLRAYLRNVEIATE